MWRDCFCLLKAPLVSLHGSEEHSHSLQQAGQLELTGPSPALLAEGQEVELDRATHSVVECLGKVIFPHRRCAPAWCFML